MPFNKIPAVDENNNFPTPIRQAIAAYAELVAAFAPKSLLTSFNTHNADRNNPHVVTKAQVGLSLVDNVSVLADYVAKWKPNTAYAAGQQVLSPRGELLTSKTARNSGATWNATEVANWKGLDKSMMLVNGGFNWSGGVTSWDAGPLTVDTTGMNQGTAGEAFCAPGSISGTVKFLEPGNYDMFWYVTPGADPGNAGYRINASSSGTAWPLPAMDNSGIVMGSGNRMAGQLYWETTVNAVGIKVDTVGQEVRLQGVQQNASTNKALVKVVKRSSI